MSMAGWLRGLIGLLLSLGVCLAVPAQPTQSPIQNIEIVAADQHLLLSADASLGLGERLIEAAERGVGLVLMAELELTQSRWYWFDRKVLRAERRWRISHNALTRQWRLAADDALALQVGSLDEALRLAGRIRDWKIALPDGLPDGELQGRLRLRIDLSQLPKPFQLNALSNSDWTSDDAWTPFVLNLRDERP